MKTAQRWILGVAVVAACASGAWLWSGREKYLRYTSPPLADGTRCTFRYPARLKVRIVDASSDTRRSGLKLRVSEPDANGCANIHVATNLAHQRGKTFRLHDISTAHHSVLIGDARSQVELNASHVNCTTQEQQFEREDKVVSESFQILPPGAPVPSP